MFVERGRNMNMLDILLKIVIFIAVTGGFIFFLCLINLAIDYLLKMPLGEPVIKMHKK